MENQPNATVFVQHYGDITANTANTTCHFIERTTGKLYTPRDLPAGSPVWLEYYDNEQDCNYYQHSVTKQKVWTVEDIDAAEEESQHSIGVAFSREKKSSSPPRSPARRGNSRLLNNSTKKIAMMRRGRPPCRQEDPRPQGAELPEGSSVGSAGGSSLGFAARFVN